MLLFICGSTWAKLNALPNQKFESVFSLSALWELFMLWVIGAAITTIFGVPVLLLLDKFFKRFALRYVIGGAFAAWIAWLPIAGPVFYPAVWHNPQNWIGSGLGHVGIYVSVGFTTGAMLTAAIWWMERRGPT